MDYTCILSPLWLGEKGSTETLEIRTAKTLSTGSSSYEAKAHIFLKRLGATRLSVELISCKELANNPNTFQYVLNKELTDPVFDFT